jgi:hypothetical protein
MARAAGDISLKWVAAQEYTISGYQNLANAAYAVGNELDLSALDNVVDLLAGSKHKTASGTLAVDPFVQLYALAPVDGTNYPAAAVNYRPVGDPIVVAAANAQEYSNLYSIAEAFGGVLPDRIKLAAENRTGLSMSNTADECEVYYVLVYASLQGS